MPWWVWALNICGWPLVHMGVSSFAFSRSLTAFDPNAPLYRSRAWEQGGNFYRRFFGIKSWKSFLPEGAQFFSKSFSKARVQSRNPDYLQRFLLETCRGEWAHWVTMACAPLFFLWNPLWADLVMVLYALIANLPCIVVQRYNRLQINRILAHPASSRRIVVGEPSNFC